MPKLNSLPFSKYEGCGNDFILIDWRQLKRDAFLPEEIRTLCSRKQGIGADGLITLDSSQKGDARMRIYNADGSEAEMCGNGIRCLMKFMRERGFSQETAVIETAERLLKGSLCGEDVIFEMGTPTDIRWDAPLETWQIHFLNTGVPHAVIFVDHLDTADVQKWGSFIRFHPLFQPQGTNVNFVQIKGPQILSIRTYERGVEGETLACGTGATAAALAYAHLHKAKSPISVLTRSLDSLTISFTPDWSLVQMQGPARKVFEGNTCLFI